MDRFVCLSVKRTFLKGWWETSFFIKENLKMSKKIKGRIYYWVDTIYDDDLIYDVYEDDYGNQIQIVVGERY